MKEIFLDVVGFEGLYSVSNAGYIYSYKNWKNCGRIMKQHIRKNGYCEIGLSRDKKRKTYLVHRIVAKAFIPNPNNLPEVNHKNGIKTDNNVNNLEWVTSSQNQIHAIKNGLQNFTQKHRDTARLTCKKNGEKNKGKIFKTRKTNKEQDTEIKKRFNNGESSLKLAVEFGVSKKTILNIKNDRKY